MKLIFTTILSFVSLTLSAQLFTEADPAPPFENVSRGATAFVDVDNDDDLDVFIAGGTVFGANSSPISKLYLNDGMGNYTEMMNTPFEGIAFGSIAFADIDGDNDQDLLISGRDGLFNQLTNSFNQVSKLYTNDGMGNFTLMTGTPFVNVEQSSIAFADIDGDNDQDLLISGGTNLYSEITRLYINDGMGNFTLMTGTPFVNVGNNGSIAFEDVDGDNDQDVLITGFNNDSGGPVYRFSRLYFNDGMGNFTEQMDSPFIGVDDSSIAFADIDGDNDSDVLITGTNDGFIAISKLYTNDGMGNFTEVIAPFETLTSPAVAFEDIDGDNDLDVLITGRMNTNNTTKLYTNDGMGNFTEMMGTSFINVYNGFISFADIDNDNDPDMLITGNNSSLTPTTRLYINNCALEMDECGICGGPGVITWYVDADNDGLGDTNVTEDACEQPDGFVNNANDEDDDCVGEVDQCGICNGPGTSTWYADTDNDGLGDPNTIEEACEQPDGFVNNSDDNDDTAVTSIENIANSGLSITPNPTTEFITVSFNAYQNQVSNLKIYNIVGKQLYTNTPNTSLGKNSIIIDVSEFPKGIYFLGLDEQKRSKFIVK